MVYDMRVRLRRKRIRDLKATLVEIEKIEELERAKVIGKGGASSRKHRRRVARLDVLPEDRVCPICSEVKIDSRRWDVTGDKVVCLSCARLRALVQKGIGGMPRSVRRKLARARASLK